jgi:hypothetical protein
MEETPFITISPVATFFIKPAAVVVLSEKVVEFIVRTPIDVEFNKLTPAPTIDVALIVIEPDVTENPPPVAAVPPPTKVPALAAFVSRATFTF